MLPLGGLRESVTGLSLWFKAGASIKYHTAEKQMTTPYEREMAIEKALGSAGVAAPEGPQSCFCGATVPLGTTYRTRFGHPLCGRLCYAKHLDEERSRLPPWCTLCGHGTFAVYKSMHKGGVFCSGCVEKFAVEYPAAWRNVQPIGWSAGASDCCSKAQWKHCVGTRCTTCPEHGDICKGSHE
jgi:hypothetical protein